MLRTSKYNSCLFFSLAFGISLFFWGLASYISYQPELSYLLFPLVLLGMSGPTLSALILIYKSHDKSLWQDFLDKLKPNKIKFSYFFLYV